MVLNTWWLHLCSLLLRVMKKNAWPSWLSSIRTLALKRLSTKTYMKKSNFMFLRRSSGMIGVQVWASSQRQASSAWRKILKLKLRTQGYLSHATTIACKKLFITKTLSSSPSTSSSLYAPGTVVIRLSQETLSLGEQQLQHPSQVNLVVLTPWALATLLVLWWVIKNSITHRKRPLM